MKKVAVIDNYDSFVYNLIHYIEELDTEVVVYRNDKFNLEDLESFDKILLSPGPGLPKNSGLLMDVIDRYHSSKSILGVCLGHQAITEYFGGELENLDDVYHGVESEISVKKKVGILKDVDDRIVVGRYHSWVSKAPLPDCLDVTCEDDDGVIMGLVHKEFDVQGVQFHPESVLTKNGKQMIKNWINYTL